MVCRNDETTILLAGIEGKSKFIDNHDSHRSHVLTVYCRKNEAELLSHCTPMPLDVSVFGPFKDRCKPVFDNYMSQRPSKLLQ